MSTSADPNHQTIYSTDPSNPMAPIMGGTNQFEGTDIMINNPGMQDPGKLNPYANSELQNNLNLYNNDAKLMGQFENSAAGSAFNPSFYNGMMNTQQAQITNSLGNEYASRGLSGSSAEMGGLNSAIQQNQMSWMNRQQSDQMRAMQGMEGLTSQMQGLDQSNFNDIMGIQGQYGNFEDVFNQDMLGILGMQQQQQQANQGFWGGIIGAGLGAGGTAAGGAFGK